MLKRVLWSKNAIAALLCVIAIAFGTGAIWHIRKARAALLEIKQTVADRSTVSVRSRGFTPAPNTTARMLRGSYEIRDLAEFQGRIYAATSNGLLIFTPDGEELEHWTPLEEFPSSDLTAITVAIDSLWIATGNAGLIRYSNHQWTHFLPDKTEHRSIYSLLSTSQGTLLAGTNAGILAFQGDAFELFIPALQRQRITSIAGNAHQLCIGTFDNGLFTYEGGILARHATQDPYVTHVQIDSKGCYASTPAGLQILENKAFRTIARNLFVTSFAIDSILWIATRDRGVIPYNTQKSAPVISGADVKSAPVTVVRKLGTQIVAASGTEISFLENGKQWQKWSPPRTILSDTNVSSLLLAQNGELWIGYFDNGLDIRSPSADTVTHLRDDTLFCINHISEDQKGRKYVSTANGLVIFEPDRSRKTFTANEGLLSDRVMQTLPLDPEGKNVAIATTQGFTLKQGNSMKSIYAFHGLVNNHVYSMALDQDQLYLGTLGGISRVRNLQVTENWTQMDSGLKRNWVNALISINHRLFVGTYGSGIQIKTENGDWYDFPSLPEDLEINPNALYYDGTYLFCGTLDRGFYVYNTKENSWKQVTRGLPALNVTAFAADDHFLYVGTDSGLLQMSYDNIRTTDPAF